jgi:hypothetical protein
LNEEEFIKQYFTSKKKKENINELYAPLIPALVKYYVARTAAKAVTQGVKNAFKDSFISDKIKSSDKSKDKQKTEKEADFKNKLDNLTNIVRNDGHTYFKFFLITYTVRNHFEMNSSDKLSDTDIDSIYDQLFNNNYYCTVIDKKYDDTKNICAKYSKEKFNDIMKEMFNEDKSLANQFFEIIEIEIKNTSGKIPYTKIKDIYLKYVNQKNPTNRIG